MRSVSHARREKCEIVAKWSKHPAKIASFQAFDDPAGTGEKNYHFVTKESPIGRLARPVGHHRLRGKSGLSAASSGLIFPRAGRRLVL